MKKNKIYSTKFIPLSHIRQKPQPQLQPKIKPKNKLTKENQDFIKQISGAGFIEI